jgi:hypothetical protein
LSNPKEIRLNIEIQETMELEGEELYKSLLDILIDQFGCRHIEKMEDKMAFILGHRKTVYGQQN